MHDIVWPAECIPLLKPFKICITVVSTAVDYNNSYQINLN